MEKYLFNAKATAAHFTFLDSKPPFGDEFTISLYSETPDRKSATFPGLSRGGISFGPCTVTIDASDDGNGVYTTTVTTSVQNLNVKGFVTVDLLEGGLVTQYRREWYDTRREKVARVAPLPVKFQNLKVCGEDYSPILQLPEHFQYDATQRQRLLDDPSTPNDPQEIAQAPTFPRRVPAQNCEFEVSGDTRRIRIANFGIVSFADWKWTDTGKSAHRLTLIGLDLRNPGGGGGGTVDGNGSPYPPP